VAVGEAIKEEEVEVVDLNLEEEAAIHEVAAILKAVVSSNTSQDNLIKAMVMNTMMITMGKSNNIRKLHNSSNNTTKKVSQ
jgi:hypothetical protein